MQVSFKVHKFNGDLKILFSNYHYFNKKNVNDCRKLLARKAKINKHRSIAMNKNHIKYIFLNYKT
jgi:hypothetical protein